MPIRRLLIADDDPDTRLWIRMVLADQFDAISEVSNGRELFWELLRCSFQDREIVAIADVVLPCYDGLSVLDACRYLGYQVPVIVISGLANAEIERRTRALGARFLTKPFTAELLRDTVALVA